MDFWNNLNAISMIGKWGGYLAPTLAGLAAAVGIAAAISRGRAETLLDRFKSTPPVIEAQLSMPSPGMLRITVFSATDVPIDVSGGASCRFVGKDGSSESDGAFKWTRWHPSRERPHFSHDFNFHFGQGDGTMGMWVEYRSAFAPEKGYPAPLSGRLSRNYRFVSGRLTEEVGTE